jgi:hypothetical protein
MKCVQQEDERTRAGKRIMAQQGLYGGARPCALAWLLTFAQEPITALSLTELTLRWEEVKRFAEDAGLGEGPPLTNQRSIWPQLPAVVASPFTHQRTTPGPGVRDFLQSVQAVVSTSLKLYVTEKRIRYGGLAIDIEVNEDTPGVIVHAADLQTGFFYQMYHLLGDLRRRIKQCGYRSCQRLFLAGRADRAFCSGLCQAKQYKLDHPKKSTKKTQERKGRQHGKKR